MKALAWFSVNNNSSLVLFRGRSQFGGGLGQMFSFCCFPVATTKLIGKIGTYIYVNNIIYTAAFVRFHIDDCQYINGKVRGT